MKKSLCFFALLVFALGVMTGLVYAQTATGQITGTVKDASGAVLANAKVTVTNEATSFSRETSTTEAGTYVFPLLPVGMYTVAVTQQGFSTSKQSGIPLTVDKIARVDFDLKVGDVSATIDIQSAAITLDTETASMGQTVTQRQVTQLPLNGRNFLQLLQLNGGTVETNGEQGTMRQGAGNAISINGARPTSNNFLIDGTSNTDTALGTPAAILSIDAIQEFKEQTGTYSAEYGFSAN
jgi:hypothetical protein